MPTPIRLSLCPTPGSILEDPGVPRQFASNIPTDAMKKGLAMGSQAIRQDSCYRGLAGSLKWSSQHESWAFRTLAEQVMGTTEVA